MTSTPSSWRDGNLPPVGVENLVRQINALTAENESLKRDHTLFNAQAETGECHCSVYGKPSDEGQAWTLAMQQELEQCRTEIEQIRLINFRRVEEGERMRKALTMIRNAVDITRGQVTEGWIIAVADDALARSIDG